MKGASSGGKALIINGFVFWEDEATCISRLLSSEAAGGTSPVCRLGLAPGGIFPNLIVTFADSGSYLLEINLHCNIYH